jgi:EAL domain-containing protein (putative c-di-GMP-specific phosphodiesterase class I)
MLVVEITETALIVDPLRATAVLQRLHDHGVHVSLDDFGQGYTSLAQLGRLPLDELKIDRAFVSDMLANANDRTIVETVIDLAHNFGLEVVAEGVETTEVLDALRTLGCDSAQGFVLARPMSAARLVEWVESFGSRDAPHHAALFRTS